MYHIIIISSKGIKVSVNTWENPELLSANLVILQEIHPDIEYCIGVFTKPDKNELFHNVVEMVNPNNPHWSK